MSYLSRGVHGEPVRILQTKLGITADGIFGGATDEALRSYQSQNGLDVDGVAGPDTFRHMELHELLLLGHGARGEAVKTLQTGLGIAADGQFGHGTDAAVRSFQEQHGLDVDGIAGPRTLAQVPGFEAITPEKVGASEIKEDTPQVDPAAVDAAAQTEPPPQGIVAKVEAGVAAVGKSIWNTLKKIV
jgi:peptidoglycan hydrolase-like protein with peptidoglycan-binding domain